MMVKFKGNLTRHFSLSEYAIGNTTGTVYVTKESMAHARRLERLRRKLKMPMYVTSWFRTPELNAKVGGIPTSNHLKGLATDFHLDVVITEKLAIKIMRMWKAICNNDGVNGEAGLYPWGMHLGSGVPIKGFKNWDSRSGNQKNQAFNI